MSCVCGGCSQARVLRVSRVEKVCSSELSHFTSAGVRPPSTSPPGETRGDPLSANQMPCCPRGEMEGEERRKGKKGAEGVGLKGELPLGSVLTQCVVC